MSGGRASRANGDRIERELVERHKAIGVHAERWLGEYDALFLCRNNADPLVVVPWRIWARLLEKVRS